uniref:Uncharacterized protein n=1 Tax=Octopus bimaculoides TaxID=37653 RepID=A0A0L8FQ85_OCTBM
MELICYYLTLLYSTTIVVSSMSISLSDDVNNSNFSSFSTYFFNKNGFFFYFTI